MNTDSALYLARIGSNLTKNTSSTRHKALAEFGLGYSLFASGKYRESILTYRKAHELYTSGRRKKGQANCYSNIALSYVRLGEYDSAYHYYNMAKDMFVILRDSNMLGQTYNQLAIVRDYQGQRLSSLDHYFMALKIFEGIKNEYGQSVILLNIATIYGEMKDMKMWERYINRSLEKKVKIGDETGEAIILNILADEDINNGQLKNAEKNLNRTIQIFYKLNDKEKIAKTLCIKSRLYSEQKQFPKAIATITEAIGIQRKFEIYSDLCSSLRALGEIYLMAGRHKEAVECCREAELIAEKTGNLDQLRASCKCLSNGYEKLNDHKSALFAYKKFTQLKDSLLNDELTREATRKEMQFNFSKKQLEDSLIFAQKESFSKLELREKEAIIRSEKSQKMVMYGGMGFLMIVVILSIRSYRIKKRDNELIAAQKKEVEEQKNLVDIKQKEIIDSIQYARRIQNTLMPTDRSIGNHLRKLKN